ncbi:MAG: hypothetical protein HW416_1123 [Chloroflexi bacterium]|nr:hypothetical protein [Chloroflexota bacterium]
MSEATPIGREVPRSYGAPVTMRSKLMLEAASYLVGSPDWAERQVEIHFRDQGDDSWKVRFFASDSPRSIEAVVRGDADIAICNPGAVLAMALHGAGPFKEPIPVRSILVLPQWDLLCFAVTNKTGLTSLADLRDKKYPLRLGVRTQPDHSVHLIMNEVLSKFGFSVNDIESWGGKLYYSNEMPQGPARLGAVRRGELDAIFDEAFRAFAGPALDAGMRFLPVDEPQLSELDAMGLRRIAIPADRYGLEKDVWTVNFSGWPVFCLDSTSDHIVSQFCGAVEAKKDRVPWYGDGPMRLDQMCKDTTEGPLTIPLHPAAERFWKERGYIS